MRKAYQYGIIALLITAHVYLGLGAMRSMSPTYDEAVHLASGYSYLRTGDYRLNTYYHPPFAEMWAAVPLLALRPALQVWHPYWAEALRYQYPFADLFLYRNRVDPETMLGSGRVMVLALSVLLGLLMFFWSRELYGSGAAFVALTLWAFSSAFIANGTVVSTDMALTLFYFSTLYLFWKWGKRRERGGRPTVVFPAAIGVSLGLMLASKYSAVAVFPVLVAILYFTVGRKHAARTVRDGLLACAAAFVVVLLVYRFNSLYQYYWAGFKGVMTGVNTGRSSFLLGQYSTTGWKHYFPLVFLLKTPLALILMLGAAVSFRRLRSKEALLYLMLPAAFYFTLSCLSKVQIGHRHILPVYPFLMVWASGLYPCLRGRLPKAALALMLVWYAAAAVRIHPWHLSYFNELVPSPDSGYRYLTDSNVDWGQGLKALGGYLRSEKIGAIYLDYFGTGDPSYYGIRFRPIGFIDSMGPGGRRGDACEPEREKRTLLAISATNLQATYYQDKKIFAYLKDIPPEKIIAHSILVYDLSAHPEQYRKFRELYAAVETGMQYPKDARKRVGE